MHLMFNLSSHISCSVKKISFAVMFGTILFSTTAFANDAPIFGNEITARPVPSGVNILTTPIAKLPTPKTAVGNIHLLPTTIIAQTTKNDDKKLDVTLLDDYIDSISANARHYPPSFANRTSEYQAKQVIEKLSKWLDPYATQSNASFDLLLRTAKINSMARNLDMGSDYAVKASTAITKALKLNPNHAEANFLYGVMLAEGGGFKEGEKYLTIAANQGYLEAEQSLAQSDLLSDNRTLALTRLQRLQSMHPNNTQIAKQIDLINKGEYYIWAIKDK